MPPRAFVAVRASHRLLRAAAHIVHGFAIVSLRFDRLDAAQRRQRVQRWSARLLQILGVAVQVRGQPDASAPMVVGNHISWLDIIALHAQSPQTRFVAKSDVRGWPLIGRMAADAGTLFVERGSGRRAASMVQQVADALRAGETVAVFPEGTTSDGHGVLPFHASLLQSAVLAGVAVQPLALRYADARHAVSPHAPYIGDTSLLQSLWMTCSAQRLQLHVHWLPACPAPHADRRRLSATLHADISAVLPPAR